MGRSGTEGSRRCPVGQADSVSGLLDPLDEIAFVGYKDKPKILSHGLGFGAVTWHHLMSTVLIDHLKLAW